MSLQLALTLWSQVSCFAFVSQIINNFNLIVVLIIACSNSLAMWFLKMLLSDCALSL